MFSFQFSAHLGVVEKGIRLQHRCRMTRLKGIHFVGLLCYWSERKYFAEKISSKSFMLMACMSSRKFALRDCCFSGTFISFLDFLKLELSICSSLISSLMLVMTLFVDLFLIRKHPLRGCFC